MLWKGGWGLGVGQYTVAGNKGCRSREDWIGGREDAQIC